MEEETIARIKTIIDLPEDQRQKGDTRWVGDQITDMKYFCKLVKDHDQRNEFARYVARYVKYQFIAQGEELFRMGAPGGEFYLIMKGKVEVFIPKASEVMENELKDAAKKDVFHKYDEFVKETFRTRGENFPKWFIPNEEEADGRKLYKSRSVTIDSGWHGKSRDVYTDVQQNEHLIQALRRFILLQENGIWHGDPKLDFSEHEKLLFLNHTKIAPYFLNQIATFRRINTLNSGDYLGEIALIFNSTRTASIIASKDTYLLWLTEKDYKEIFQSEVQNVREKVDFIGNIFSNTSKPQVSKFCYLLEEQQMYHNEVLFKEGDKSDFIYIVRHGEIQLTTVITQEHQSRENSTIKKTPFYRRKLIIQTLKMGSFFGEDEFLSKTPRKYTAIAGVSNTLIYKISRNAYQDIIEKYFDFISIFLKKNHKQKSKKLRDSMLKQAEIRLSDFKQVDDMLGKMNEEKKEKYDKVYTRPSLTVDKRLELRVSVKHVKNENLMSIPPSGLVTERSNRSPSKSPEKIERLSITSKLVGEQKSITKLEKKASVSSLSSLNLKRFSSEVYPSSGPIDFTRFPSQIYSSQGNRDMLAEQAFLSLQRSMSQEKSQSPKREVSLEKSANLSAMKTSPPGSANKIRTMPDLDNYPRNRGSQATVPSIGKINGTILPTMVRSDTRALHSQNSIFNSRYTLIDKFDMEDRDKYDKEESKKQFMHIMKRVLKKNTKEVPQTSTTQPEIIQSIMESPTAQHTSYYHQAPYLTTLSSDAPSTRDSEGSRFTNLHLQNNFAKGFEKYRSLLAFKPLNGADRLNYQQRLATVPSSLPNNNIPPNNTANTFMNTSVGSQRSQMHSSNHKKKKSSRVMALDDQSINKSMRTGMSAMSPRSPSSFVDFNKTIQITDPGNGFVPQPQKTFSGFRGKKYI